MPYTIQRMTEAEARQIGSWRYPAPFSFYNPNEAYLKEYIEYLANPRYQYYAVYRGAELWGFCCFGEEAQVPGGDYSLPDTLDVGLGMHPQKLGQGHGKAFLAAILAFAQSHFGAKNFRATIATFNQHSQRLFANAGFQPVQRFRSSHDNATEFVVVIRRETALD